MLLWDVVQKSCLPKLPDLFQIRYAEDCSDYQKAEYFDTVAVRTCRVVFIDKETPVQVLSPQPSVLRHPNKEIGPDSPDLLLFSSFISLFLRIVHILLQLKNGETAYDNPD